MIFREAQYVMGRKKDVWEEDRIPLELDGLCPY